MQLTLFPIQLLYPICISSCSYYFLKFPGADFENYLIYLSILALTATSGSVFGFMFGAIFSEVITAQKILELMVMILSFGAGVLANAGSGATWLIRFMTWVSPIRYQAELLFRQLIKDDSPRAQTYLLAFFNYNYGNTLCYSFVMGFIVFCFIASWLILVYSGRKL